jgi:putative hemolysin
MIFFILLLLPIAFLLLAFFNGSEMAYVSCNKLKLRYKANEGDRAAQEIYRLHRDPKRFLTMILVGTNFMHVTVVGLATFLLESQFHIEQEWVITSILALPIIIFAESVPKDWFRHRADDFIYRFAGVLGFFDRALSGFSQILADLSDSIIRVTMGDIKGNPFITREEFRYVIEESAKDGVLHEHEKQLIHTILNLSTVPVSDVMVPVAQFPKLSLTSHVGDIKSLARKVDTDAILVYEEIPSIVVGIIHVFDVLFEEDEGIVLSRFLKAPLFIPQDTNSERAIFLLQSKHASFGVVTSPRGEVIGVVRLENLIRVRIPHKP